MKIEKMILNAERNVTLTAYVQEVKGEFSNIPKRPAILIIPGGGYAMCSDREAEPVAFAYLQAGYQAFVLRYSVGNSAKWPNPLNDYEQAMALIRSNADLWNLYADKIAVIGFSAGGHLAACAATIAQNKPNAAILGYAVLEESSAKMWLTSAPDTVSLVDENTCPCFLFTTRNDNIVPVKNSLYFMNALEAHGIMFESHIYAYGPHGFSTCNSSVTTPGTAPVCNRVPRWVNDSIEWLKDTFGDFHDGNMSEPKCTTRINGNADAFLSIDCTIQYLMENPKAREILAPLMEAMQQNTPGEYKKRAVESAEMSGIASVMKLSSVLSYAKMSEDMVDKINQKLKKIPNV